MWYVSICDRHNFILDFVVNAGNIHDSVMFDEVYDKAVKRLPGIKVIAADAGYMFILLTSKKGEMHSIFLRYHPSAAKHIQHKNANSICKILVFVSFVL